MVFISIIVCYVLVIHIFNRVSFKVSNSNYGEDNYEEQIQFLIDNNVNNKRARFMVEALLKTTNNMTEIARKLNQGGFTTSKGSKFTAIQVIRLINRYNLR